MKINYCAKCKLYTMKPFCSNCKENTITPKPAKFSIEDKYQKYRLVYKKNVSFQKTE